MSFVERHFEFNGGTQVIVRFFEPVAEKQQCFRCDYEIAWPDAQNISRGYGADAVQALVLAMQGAHVDLLASARARAGELTWLGNRDLELPLPANTIPADFS